MYTKYAYNAFLLTRPYSWISIIFIGIIANILANGSLVYNANFFIDILVSILVWLSGNFVTELFHKDCDNRTVVSKIIPVFIVALLFFIVSYRNADSAILLASIYISIFIYALKNKPLFMSRFSFFFRGGTEFFLFLLILSFYSVGILQFINVALIIYFITISRNLIGDVRDIKFDKYTFPKTIGVNGAYFLSLVFVLISVYIIWDLWVAFPLLIISLYIIFDRNAYFMHRLFVLVSMFFFLNIIFHLLSYSLAISNLVFIGTLLNFTYTRVPRKSNPEMTYFTG